jgi:hypothetical protein
MKSFCCSCLSKHLVNELLNQTYKTTSSDIQNCFWKRCENFASMFCRWWLFADHDSEKKEEREQQCDYNYFFRVVWRSVGNKTLETLNSGFRVLRALVFSLSLSPSVRVQTIWDELSTCFWRYWKHNSNGIIQVRTRHSSCLLAPWLGFLLLCFLGPHILPDWQELASLFFLFLARM